MKRPLALPLIIITLLCACGCKARDYAPKDPLDVPQAPRWENFIAPEVPGSYAGFSISIKPVLGPKLTLADSACVNLVLQSFSENGKIPDEDKGGSFPNMLTILDAEGRQIYSFGMSADGEGRLKADDGRIFPMPQYVYYTLQWNLLSSAGSMRDILLKWDPESTSTAALQSALPDIIKTIKIPSMGYAQAYFAHSILYDYVVSDKNKTLKLYIMSAFSGYTIQGESFHATIRDIRPAQITLTLEKEGYWRPAQWKEAEKQAEYNDVRTVLPYEYAKQGVADYAAREVLVADLDRQALDYLRRQGLVDLPITGTSK